MAHYTRMSPPQKTQSAALWGWWAALFILCVLVPYARILGLVFSPPAPGEGASTTDMLMAGRIAAARQSDYGMENTSWAGDPGAVRFLGRGRYQVNGSVLGRWQGRPGVRRFEAVIEDRRGGMFYTDLPIREFRFLDP